MQGMQYIRGDEWKYKNKKQECTGIFFFDCPTPIFHQFYCECFTKLLKVCFEDFSEKVLAFL